MRRPHAFTLALMLLGLGLLITISPGDQGEAMAAPRDCVELPPRLPTRSRAPERNPRACTPTPVATPTAVATVTPTPTTTVGVPGGGGSGNPRVYVANALSNNVSAID